MGYQEVKTKINNVVRTNGNQGITGANMNEVLNDMLDYSQEGGGVSVSQNTLSIGGEDVGELAGQLIENPEWVKVVTDNEDKILYGVKTDGKFYFGDDCPPQVKEYVNNYVGTYGYNKDTIDALLATKVDKVIGKSLIDTDYASSKSAIDNPEWLKVETDEDGRVLGGRKPDGKLKENVGVDIVACEISNIKDGEERFEIKTDSGNRIISYRDKNGVLHESAIKTDSFDAENAGIETLNVKDVHFEDEIPEQIKECIPGETADIIHYNDLLSIGTRILKIYNPYKNSHSNQYVGQLHCHTWTMLSGYDGKIPYGYTAEEMSAMTDEERAAALNSVQSAFVARHKELGYHFMTISDYWRMYDVTHKPSPFPSSFLWLCDSYEGGMDYEGNTSGCDAVVLGALKAENFHGRGINMDYVVEHCQDEGSIVEFAHPFETAYYVGKTYLDTIKRRLRFIEVWNGMTMKNAASSFKPGIMNDEAFDILLSNGNFIFCTGVTDERPTLARTGEGYNVPNTPENLKRGCIKVFADNLASNDIFASMLEGNFYVSSNVDKSINSVAIENGQYIVDVGEAGVVVEFVGKNNTVLDTITTSSEDTTAAYNIQGSNEGFVRARLYKTNSNPYDPTAWWKNKEWVIWTQPVFISREVI